jgi:hypothetical protein
MVWNMYIYLILFVLTLSGCSLFERRNELPQRTVKDQIQGQGLGQNKTKAGDAGAGQGLDPMEGSSKSGLRYRLLVLPFLDASTTRPSSFREGARKRLLVDLNRTGQVIALGTEDYKTNFKVDPKTLDYDLPAIAKDVGAFGVSGILEGKVMDFRVQRKTGQVGIVRNLKSAFDCVVRVRVLSVRGGREVFNTVKTVTIEQADIRVAERIDSDRFIEANPELTESMIQEAFLEFSPQVLKSLEKLQWEGRVAAVQGSRVFLNVGRLSGLKIGDILKVVDEGEDVYDPESGHRIGQVQGRMKGTLEVVSFFGQDGAVTLIHSGAGFKENDHVELY